MLEALNNTDEETVAQCRGDSTYEDGITNRYLKDLIKNLKNAEEKLTNGEGIDGEDSGSDRASQDKEGAKEKTEQDEGMEGGSNKNANEAPKTDIEKFNHAKKILERYLSDIIAYETPLRHCYFFKNEIWLKYLACYNAANLFIYFGLYAILNKMNLLAIIYWICFWRVINRNFKPNIFKTERNEANPTSLTRYNVKAKFGSAKNLQIISLLKIQIFVISLFIIW